jgi:trk system potassium uptake protein TrkH
MLMRPTSQDVRLIGFSLGRILVVVAVAGLFPLGWALVAGETAPAASFFLMIGIFGALGFLLMQRPPESSRLEWSHGMVVVGLTWLIVPAIGAVPLELSGHYGSFIDPYFDAMSGLTTTGLTLIQDLDHLATSLNFWRHLLHFLGGQGIVLAVLSVFAGGGAMTLYYGEARDEQIFPSVRSTARFIWLVSVVHAAFGVVALGAVGYFVLGFRPFRAIFHAITIFMAAFDTGGFAPQSSSLGYYHSGEFEAVTAVLMIAGALSFGLHFALWRGGRRVVRDLEVRTILATFLGTLLLTVAGLAGAGTYESLPGLSRQGFFQVLSAHTGTGFATIPLPELASWAGLAFGGMAIAMALGGMGSSTAGGVKSLRIGLTVKALGSQIRQVLLPEGAVISTRYWHHGWNQLNPGLIQAVMGVSLLYVALYLLGTGVGLVYNLPLESALFESVSAGANVGLSVGVTNPSMPMVLKLTYIFQMWTGRLEFVAVFSLIGFMFSLVRGK